MDCEASMEHLLECMLLDPSAEPTNLPMWLLKTITNNFSDDEKIGSGGFAAVYRGELQNGTVIAVKKLFHNLDMDEEKFTKEVGCLMKAKHKNIVRFFGYCSDTQGKILNHEEKMILAEERHRLLCFEFLPKGSLDKHITDVSEGLEWRTRYKIIKGICDGLHYLHQDIHIVHSDLKPANILLDENTVPKIADFGLARCFDGNQSKTITSKVMGTVGYLAPESYDGMITFKSDIYSLGVIIMEILTGRKGYCDIQNVLQSWSVRFKPSQEDIWLQHVRVCAEIGRQCIDRNPADRPDTLYIIERLDQMERTCGFIETDICASSATQVLDVYPLNIWFPFKQNKLTKCPVTLTNKTDDLIGVLIAPTSLDACFNPGYPYVWEQTENIKVNRKSSIFRRLEPHSSETIYMTMRKQEQPPLDAADKGMFDVVMVATKSEKDLERLDRHWNYGTWRTNKSEDPLRRAKELGTVVHLATLRAAVSSYPARRQEVAAHQFKPFEPDEEYWYITCMDVHPTNTWLLVGYDIGHVSIWNYETQERVAKFKVKYLKEGNYLDRILSVKFIAGEQWFAAGDDIGGVHVYAYPNFGAESEKDKVKEFKAHVGNRSVCGVNKLDVSPKHTLLLTASCYSPGIKLWDWSQGWTCTRVIYTHDPVRDLKVGPRDASTFASSTGYNNNVVEFWDIHSPDAIATFEGPRFTFYTDSRQNFLATISGDGPYPYNAKIWDLQTKEHVHTLCPGMRLRDRLMNPMLCSHPTLPILAGLMMEYESKVHEIVLWDVRTYRVVKWVELIMEGILLQMVFDVTKDITKVYRKSQMLINSTIAQQSENLEKHLKKKRP